VWESARLGSKYGVRRANREERSYPRAMRRGSWIVSARGLALAVVVGAALDSSWSSAQDTQAASKEACADAYAKSQELKVQGKLLEARSRMIFCGQSSCPAVVRRECLQTMPDLETMIPSVVFSVRTSEGKDVPSAAVTLDGAPQAMDGKPVMLDPGGHKVECDAPGFTHYQTTVLASSGEKNRLLSIIMIPNTPATPPPSASSTNVHSDVSPAGSALPPPEPAHGLPAATYVLGGIGIAALASMTYFGLSGFSDADDMEKSCKPHCAQSDVDAAHTKILIANISFGVGVAALGGAVWTALASHSDARPGKKEAAGRPMWGVDVTPASGGGLVRMSTRF
jgi:hypothetical protein